MDVSVYCSLRSRMLMACWVGGWWSGGGVLFGMLMAWWVSDGLNMDVCFGDRFGFEATLQV